jgi:hypothetical protein
MRMCQRISTLPLFERDPAVHPEMTVRQLIMENSGRACTGGRILKIKRIANMKILKVLGKIKLDSGRILLCDPCRTDGRINFMQESFRLSRTDGFQLPDQLAVVVPTGLSDGSFDVEVVFDELPDREPEIREIRLHTSKKNTARIDNRTTSNAIEESFSGISK